MQVKLKPSITRGLLVAVLALGGAAAQAAGGYTVTHAQEANIKTGLTADEVRQVLGRPARVERFIGEAGPVWTYNVSGGIDPMALFEVDFGADGKVSSVMETAVLVD